jgi:hypothetical protein
VHRSAQSANFRHASRRICTGSRLRDSFADSLGVIRDAADEDDFEQVWTLLGDRASHCSAAEPRELVLVAANVLGSISLEGDGEIDHPNAGNFTIIAPRPAEAAAAISDVAPRLMNVDERGVERAQSEIAPDASHYTPNYVGDVLWSDRGAQMTRDTKGWMSAPMARGLLAIMTDSLIDHGVLALITGHIPVLAQQNDSPDRALLLAIGRTTFIPRQVSAAGWAYSHASRRTFCDGGDASVGALSDEGRAEADVQYGSRRRLEASINGPWANSLS